jgi:hypothetical protein
MVSASLQVTLGLPLLLNQIGVEGWPIGPRLVRESKRIVNKMAI